MLSPIRQFLLCICCFLVYLSLLHIQDLYIERFIASGIERIVEKDDSICVSCSKPRSYWLVNTIIPSITVIGNHYNITFDNVSITWSPSIFPFNLYSCNISTDGANICLSRPGIPNIKKTIYKITQGFFHAVQSKAVSYIDHVELEHISIWLDRAEIANIACKISNLSIRSGELVIHNYHAETSSNHPDILRCQWLLSNESTPNIKLIYDFHIPGLQDIIITKLNNIDCLYDTYDLIRHSPDHIKGILNLTQEKERLIFNIQNMPVHMQATPHIADSSYHLTNCISAVGELAIDSNRGSFNTELTYLNQEISWLPATIAIKLSIDSYDDYDRIHIRVPALVFPIFEKAQNKINASSMNMEIIKPCNPKKPIIYTCKGIIADEPLDLSAQIIYNHPQDICLHDINGRIASATTHGELSFIDNSIQGNINVFIPNLLDISKNFPNPLRGKADITIHASDNIINMKSSINNFMFKDFGIHNIECLAVYKFDNPQILPTLIRSSFDANYATVGSFCVQNLSCSIDALNTDTYKLYIASSGCGIFVFDVNINGHIQTDNLYNIYISNLCGHVNNIEIEQIEPSCVSIASSYLNTSDISLRCADGSIFFKASIDDQQKSCVLNIDNIDINQNIDCSMYRIPIIQYLQCSILSNQYEKSLAFNGSIISSSDKIGCQFNCIQDHNNVTVQVALNTSQSLTGAFELHLNFDNHDMWITELPYITHDVIDSYYACLTMNGNLSELRSLIFFPLDGFIISNLYVHYSKNSTTPIIHGGELHITHGVLSLYNHGHPLDSHFHISAYGIDNSIKIQNSSAYIDDINYCTYFGTINLLPSLKYDITMHVSSNAQPFVQTDKQWHIQFLGTGNLHLRGNFDHANLTGSIHIDNGICSLPSSSIKSYGHQSHDIRWIEDTMCDTTNMQQRFSIASQIEIVLDSPLQYIGTNTTSSWTGSILMEGELPHPVFSGTLYLQKGSYKIANSLFQLSQGSLAFNHGKLRDARWSLEGEAKLNKYTIRAYVEKIADNVAVTLKSYPFLSHNEILSRLILGEADVMAPINAPVGKHIVEPLWNLVMGTFSPSLFNRIYKHMRISNINDIAFDKIGVQFGYTLKDRVFVGLGKKYDHKFHKDQTVLVTEMKLAKQLKILIDAGYQYFKIGTAGTIEF